MKIYFAGERTLKKYRYMEWIKNRLMTYYYHSKNKEASKDIKDWFEKIKKEKKNEKS